MKRICITSLLLISLLLGACRAKSAVGVDPAIQVAAAVAATMSAIPSVTPYPTFTPYPTPTSFELNGLFCEYGFCIGHPEYVTPFDLNAADPNKRIPSTYAGGKLIGYSTDMLLLIVWQAGITDLQYMLSVVTGESGGTLTGNVDVRLIGPYNVFYQDVQPPADSTLTHGGVAAWQCGERAFAWMVYTSQLGLVDTVVDETLNKFRCGE